MVKAVVIALACVLLSSTAASAADSISGQVAEAAAGHAPIAGVTVCATASSGVHKCDMSDGLGAYLIPDLPHDTYKVAFDGLSQGYVGEFYDDADWADATEIALLGGADRSGVNAELAKGGTIEGTVADASSGLGIEEVEVCAGSKGNGMFGFSCGETRPGGAYVVSGLPDGDYTIDFWPPGSLGYVSEVYDSKFFWEDATMVPIVAANTVAGIDAELVQGGGISGAITSAFTGMPLSNIFLCGREGFGKNRIVECEVTDDAGRYTLAGMPPGSYKVEFSAPMEVFADDGFPTQYYNQKATLAEAEVVAVTAANTTVGIDARLGPPVLTAQAPAVQVSSLYLGNAKPKAKDKRCRPGYRKKKLRGGTRCVRVAKKTSRHRRHSG